MLQYSYAVLVSRTRPGNWLEAAGIVQSFRCGLSRLLPLAASTTLLYRKTRYPLHPLHHPHSAAMDDGQFPVWKGALPCLLSAGQWHSLSALPCRERRNHWPHACCAWRLPVARPVRLVDEVSGRHSAHAVQARGVHARAPRMVSWLWRSGSVLRVFSRQGLQGALVHSAWLLWLLACLHARGALPLCLSCFHLPTTGLRQRSRSRCRTVCLTY